MAKTIPERWQNTLGSGIVVAVLDTGYSPHDDLSRSVINYSSIFDNIDPIDKANGHGNMCMGIIAANSADQEGIIGIAPLSKLLSIRVADDKGNVSYDALTKGIYYASIMGADIISISIGGKQYSPELEKAVLFAYERNIPIIAAAGNDGHFNDANLVNYPAKFEQAICVGSIDENKEISWFSTAGEEIDFVSVGENVKSTFLNNTYKIDSGTSFSSPYVAGITALLLSKHRITEKDTNKNDCISIEEIKNHLREHAVDLGDVGKDKYYGNGAISLYSINHSNIMQPRKSFFSKVKDLFSYLFSSN